MRQETAMRRLSTKATCKRAFGVGNRTCVTRPVRSQWTPNNGCPGSLQRRDEAHESMIILSYITSPLLSFNIVTPVPYFSNFSTNTRCNKKRQDASRAMGSIKLCQFPLHKHTYLRYSSAGCAFPNMCITYIVVTRPTMYAPKEA